MASKQSKKVSKIKSAKKPAVEPPVVETPAVETSAAEKKTVKKKTTAKKTTAKKKTAAKKTPAKKKAVKKRKRKKPGVHYVNGKEFYDQICEYYKTEDMKDYLAESIQKIATGLSFAPNFINYSYKDEMVGDAVLKMFLALRNKKFNCETHNNPFSYFTTIAFHAFINRIKKEKKHRDTITRYQETVYGDMMQDANGSTTPIYTDPSNAVDDE